MICKEVTDSRSQSVQAGLLGIQASFLWLALLQTTKFVNLRWLDINVGMKRWESNSYLSGTMGKTEQNILLARFGPKVPQKWSHTIWFWKFPVGWGGGHAPTPPYLLHAYAHSNGRILFADQKKRRLQGSGFKPRCSEFWSDALINRVTVHDSYHNESNYLNKIK